MINVARIITLISVAVLFGTQSAFSDIIGQESFKTHLRWNLMVPRDQFNVIKRGSTLYIETVNLQLYETLAAEMARISPDSQYISSVAYSKDNFPATPATVSVKLKDSTVELFSFYRDADKKYILDFWVNADLLSSKEPEFKQPLALPVEKKKPNLLNLAKKNEDLTPVNPLLNRKSKILPVVEVTKEAAEEAGPNPEFRDVRYGASFVWDYEAMIPQLEKDINLSAKIPDSLYPIKDRENLDDPKEAHLQLAINFYRAEKWGLLNKSISLYEKKYGRDSNHVMLEFIKANALLRGNLAKPNRGITQSAMVMLANIKDLTDIYELKSAILRYLIQYNVDVRDWVRTLELAKSFFVEARGEFDQTMVIQSALTILHSLAELKQADKIEEFLADKKLMAILPPQMGMAYLSYAMLSKNMTKDLISKYQAVEKSLAKPVHPAILQRGGEYLPSRGLREGDESLR